MTFGNSLNGSLPLLYAPEGQRKGTSTGLVPGVVPPVNDPRPHCEEGLTHENQANARWSAIGHGRATGAGRRLLGRRGPGAPPQPANTRSPLRPATPAQ